MNFLGDAWKAAATVIEDTQDGMALRRELEDAKQERDEALARGTHFHNLKYSWGVALSGGDESVCITLTKRRLLYHGKS
jgi:hypothetical protein